MTDHDPATLTTPGGYLEEAQTAARNIRAWIHRYSKLHPEPREPGWDEYISNRVSWVTGVLDNLDLVLTRATQSVDHHMPLHRPQVRSPEASLNIHLLGNMSKLTEELRVWSDTVRWSGLLTVTNADMDRLDAIRKTMADSLSHLTAQAQEQELAR